MARVARRAIAIDDRMCVCVYLAQFIIARGPVALSKYYAPLRTQKPRAYLSTAKAQKKGCKLGENTQFALPIQKSCVAKPSRVLVWPTQGCKKFPISLGNEVILCRLEQALQTCESVCRTGCRVRLGLAARVS